MRVIKSYSDYLIAVRDQTSDLRYVRTEAINALENLCRSNPEKFAEYKAKQEESKKPKPRFAQGKAYDKAKYIQEHPEIQVDELRENAKERLKRGSYGFALGFELPTWLTEENLLESVDKLTISDLITGNGNPVSRQTLLRKCIKIAVAERRINEAIIRDALKDDNLWNSPANRQGMLVFALAAIDALDENLIVNTIFSYYKPVLNQIPKDIRGHAKKAFCSACSKVVSAKGIKSFISADGTINVNKLLRNIPEKGNEELFEMLSNRNRGNNVDSVSPSLKM